MRIRIRSDVPLSKETQTALSDFAYGSAWFDLDGGFRAGSDPERRQAVELVVTDRLPDGVTASPLAAPIWHLGPDPIPEGSYLLLRDDRGGLHDHRSCSQYIGTRHVFGTLFRDEAGTVWAARRADGEAGEIAADWPLEQVSAHTHPTVEAGFGQILDSLPAMGEFQLTNEIPARVAWIPWWSGFGSNPKEGVSNPAEDAVLRELMEQAGACHDTGTVHPDPAPMSAPKVIVMDTTVQEQELLVTLHDWRPDGEVGADEPGPLDLRITLRADQLLIATADGRELMIELEGDQLKAHAYNDVSDAPATLRVRNGAPIEADASDHLSEIYAPEEGPTP